MPDAAAADPLRRLSSASSERSGKAELVTKAVSGAFEVDVRSAEGSIPPKGGTFREERSAFRSSPATDSAAVLVCAVGIGFELDVNTLAGVAVPGSWNGREVEVGEGEFVRSIDMPAAAGTAAAAGSVKEDGRPKGRMASAPGSALTVGCSGEGTGGGEAPVAFRTSRSITAIARSCNKYRGVSSSETSNSRE